MSELRRDPITGRMVIVAEERAGRPSDYAGPEAATADQAQCPFCPGHEEDTPPEILAGRPAHAPPNTAGWSYRVVPNKFPALTAAPPPSTSEEPSSTSVPRRVDGHLGDGDPPFEIAPGVGAHEVIVETPDHDRSLATMSAAAVTDVLCAWRARVRALKEDPGLAHVLIWENRGRAAGATLVHPHAQLIATTVVPAAIQEELDGGRRHHRASLRCAWCDVIDAERHGPRLVCEENGFIALTPFASRVPYETMVLPVPHGSAFEESGGAVMAGLARTLGRLLRALRETLDDPAYNLVLHTGPAREPALPYFHWHLELLPKLAQVGGFEWGTGMFITTVSPERAAASLAAAVDCDTIPPRRRGRE